MNLHPYIHTDPAVLLGKPVVKGTHLSVDFLLGLLAKGWTESQILENYPQLSCEALQAVFAFTAEAMREERKTDVPIVILKDARIKEVSLDNRLVDWSRGRKASAVTFTVTVWNP